MTDEFKIQGHSRFVKAAILAAQREGNPITVTTEQLQAVRDFEDRQGEEMQVAAIIDGHKITLKVAQR